MHSGSQQFLMSTTFETVSQLAAKKLTKIAFEIIYVRQLKQVLSLNFGSTAYVHIFKQIRNKKFKKSGVLKSDGGG